MAETSSEPVKKCEECGADATTTRMIKGKKKHVCKSCAWVVDNLLK
jgi:formylmethanofuran dehydrogenase subunit E